MIPWIEEGIVGFVRAPGDLYPDLMLESIRRTERRFGQHAELNALKDMMIADELQSEHQDLFLEDLQYYGERLIDDIRPLRTARSARRKSDEPPRDGVG